MGAPKHPASLECDGAPDLQAFLEMIFGYCEGHLAVRMLRETGTPDAAPKSIYLPIDSNISSRIAAEIVPAAKDMRGLYVVPCSIRTPGNAKAENIVQTCVIPCDLDHGDIAAKQAHLELHLGPATMVVLSGGVTADGAAKRHLYWRLTEACFDTDLEKVLTIRKHIVAAVDADDAFERLTQPIRVAGSVHGKNGVRTQVRTEAITAREYDIGELLLAAEGMPRLPNLPPKIATRTDNKQKVASVDRQIRRVRAGGLDNENRFTALSGTIGHWIRQARLGHVPLEEARNAVADYNAARVEPPWPEDRLQREFDALLSLDRKKHPGEWTKQNQRPEGSGSAIEAPDHSEDSLASSFIKLQGQDWSYVAPWGTWYRWNGSFWDRDETLGILDQVRWVCRQETLGLSPGHARRIASSRTFSAVERIASSDRRVAVAPAEWDQYPLLLNTPTGTVDLETSEVLAPSRGHRLTQSAAADPRTPSTDWTDFLKNIMAGDDEMVAYLARIAGYCLTGSNREQVFFFLHGDGSNGKSVFVQTIAKALGSYAATAPLDSFMASRSSSHPTDLAGLRGKRLVSVSETEQGRIWAESRIKAITGGDPIRARFLYRDFFEFLPTFKLIFLGNHRPHLAGTGEAMRRRLQLVPFSVTIPEDRRDRSLEDRLTADLGGVLGWMMHGYMDWKENGLAPPDKVRSASAEYFDDEDSIGQWITEQCEPGDGLSSPANTLFANWTQWAVNNGVEPGSQKQFGQGLRSRGFKSGRTRTGRLWQGLAPRLSTGGMDR